MLVPPLGHFTTVATIVFSFSLSLDLLGPSPLFVRAYPFLPVLDSSCFVNRSPTGRSSFAFFY